MAKHLVDIDEAALAAARAALGTTTIKDTVNAALRRVADDKPARFDELVAALAGVEFGGRSEAWRSFDMHTDAESTS
jgi:Arc/MetJ family transcription regulator